MLNRYDDVWRDTLYHSFSCICIDRIVPNHRDQINIYHISFSIKLMTFFNQDYLFFIFHFICYTETKNKQKIDQNNYLSNWRFYVQKIAKWSESIIKNLLIDKKKIIKRLTYKCIELRLMTRMVRCGAVLHAFFLPTLKNKKDEYCP